MIFNEKFETLMNEITKQEAIIEDYADKLEAAGNIDPSIEDYLNNAREELRKKKETLIDEFKKPPKKELTKPLKFSKLSIDDAEDSPKVKVKSATPKFSSSTRVEKFPFYSVHEIEAEKVTLAKDIFKSNHQISPRVKSPSALRYSQNTLNAPLRQKTFGNIESVLRDNSTKNESPLHVQDFIDKKDPGSIEQYVKYLEEREKRVQAREKMVEMREKAVAAKEAELLLMVRAKDLPDKNTEVVRNPGYMWKVSSVDESQKKSPVLSLKPPKSPEKIVKKFDEPQNMFMSNKKKVKIT